MAGFAPRNAGHDPTRKERTVLALFFLYGGNADYIEGLYARYKADPNSIDPTWASYFGRLEDAPADIDKNAEGPSWQRRDWPQAANGELVSAFDGNWAEIQVKVQKAVVEKAKAEGAPARLRSMCCRRRATRSAPS